MAKVGSCSLGRSILRRWLFASAAFWSSATLAQANGYEQSAAWHRIERFSTAEQRYSTSPNETLEVVFPDGSSLVLASDTEVAVTYSSGLGRIDLLGGAVRVMRGPGGHPFALNAGGATFDIVDGGAFVETDRGQARAVLLFGGPLIATANDETYEVSAPGSELHVTPQGFRGRSIQSRRGAAADAARIGAIRPIGAAVAQVRFDGPTTTTDGSFLDAAVPPPPPFLRDAVASLGPGAGITLGGSGDAFVDLLNQGLSGNAQFSELGLVFGGQPVLLEGGVLTTSGGAPARPEPSQPRTTNRILPDGSTYPVSGAAGPRLLRGASPSVSYVVHGPLVFFDGASSRTRFDPIPTSPFDSDEILGVLDDLGLTVDVDVDGVETPCDSAGCADIVRMVQIWLGGAEDLRLVLGDVSGRSRISLGGPVVGTLSHQNLALSVPRSALDASNAGRAQTISGAVGVRAGGAPVPGGINDSAIQSGLQPFDAIAHVLQFGFDIADQDGDGILRAADHFLMIESRPADPSVGIDPFLFATGGLSSARAPSDAVDGFALYSSLSGALAAGTGGLGLGPGYRGFAPGDAGVFAEGDFIATPLMVANTSRSDGQNALFHADLGLSGDGALSTISVTLGALNYDNGSAVVAARTLGSSRAGGTAASTLIDSPLTNTAFGGGAWGGVARPGYVGNLVLENVAEELIPETAALTGAGAFAGGEIRPLGGSLQSYGIVRIATADGSVADQATQSFTYAGFAAGLVEQQTPTGIVVGFLDSGGVAGDPTRLRLQGDGATNRVSADLVLRGLDGVDLPILQLGGFDATSAGASALISDGAGESAAQFGAASAGGAPHDAVLVAGESLRTQSLSAIGPYRYVQWGFFFGDVLTSQDARQHVHLGSWAGGQLLPVGSYGLRGSARYSGHALASVQDGAGVRTVVGSFSQNWNLDSLRGDMALALDGAAYRTATLAVSAGAPDLRYSGAFAEAAGRVGVVHGVLLGLTPEGLPGGTAGQFQIQALPGADPYIASGSFGGDIRP